MLSPQHLFNASCSHTMTMHRVPGILTWRGPSSCNEEGISLSKPIMAPWTYIFASTYHFRSSAAAPLESFERHRHMLESRCVGEQCVTQPRRAYFSASLFSTAYLLVSRFMIRFGIHSHLPSWPTDHSVNNEEGVPYDAFIRTSWNAFAFCFPFFYSDVSLTLFDDISVF